MGVRSNSGGDSISNRLGAGRRSDILSDPVWILADRELLTVSDPSVRIGPPRLGGAPESLSGHPLRSWLRLRLLRLSLDKAAEPALCPSQSPSGRDHCSNARGAEWT